MKKGNKIINKKRKDKHEGINKLNKKLGRRGK